MKSPTLHNASSVLVRAGEVISFCFMNWMTVASRQTLLIPDQQINKIKGGPTKSLFLATFADNRFIKEVLKKTCAAVNDNELHSVVWYNGRQFRLERSTCGRYFFSASFITWCCWYNLNGETNCEHFVFVFATQRLYWKKKREQLTSMKFLLLVLLKISVNNQTGSDIFNLRFFMLLEIC